MFLHKFNLHQFSNIFAANFHLLDFLNPSKEEMKTDAQANEDYMENSKMTDDQRIKNFLTKIAIERQYILFGEAPLNGEQLPTELVTKQKYIRNKLNLGDAANEEFSLEKAFKIIDALNMQTLFVYDPEFEKY